MAGAAVSTRGARCRSSGARWRSGVGRGRAVWCCDVWCRDAGPSPSAKSVPICAPIGLCAPFCGVGGPARPVQPSVDRVVLVGKKIDFDRRSRVKISGLGGAIAYALRGGGVTPRVDPPWGCLAGHRGRFVWDRAKIPVSYLGALGCRGDPSQPWPGVRAALRARRAALGLEGCRQPTERESPPTSGRRQGRFEKASIRLSQRRAA